MVAQQMLANQTCLVKGVRDVDLEAYHQNKHKAWQKLWIVEKDSFIKGGDDSTDDDDEVFYLFRNLVYKNNSGSAVCERVFPILLHMRLTLAPSWFKQERLLC